MIRDPFLPFHSEVLEKLWHQIAQENLARIRGEPSQRPPGVPASAGSSAHRRQSRPPLQVGHPGSGLPRGAGKGRTFILLPCHGEPPPLGITPGPIASGAGEGP